MRNEIVLISGKQGSGKSSLARGLSAAFSNGYGVGFPNEFSFASPLYEMHNSCLEILDRAGIITPKKDGPLLQMLGTEWGRKYYGDDVWVNILKYEVENYFSMLCGDGIALAIIPDCRFKNELAAFPNAIKVRLECPMEIRKARILATPGQNWREDQNHRSEIDLDDVPKSSWNVIADTGILSAEETVEKVYCALKDKLEC